MCPTLKRDAAIQICEDPYEIFMLHHLQYYGLFSRLEDPFQKKLAHNRTWESICDSVLSDCEYVETNSEDDNVQSRSRSCQTKLKTKQLHFDFKGARFVPRLCQPRSLYVVPTGVEIHQDVHWPIECEVIKEEIQHIEWVPLEPEPFYQPTGCEKTPMPVGEGKGKVVYCINPSSTSSYYTCSQVGSSQRLMQSAGSCMDGGEIRTLLFESRFQSGNLQKAVQIGVHDYELTLRTDLYTSKHTQWFYFRVKNMKAGVQYRFTIVNLMKSSSLYSLGLKPLLYSERSAQTQRVGWKRIGSNIKYYRNHCEYEGQSLYSLTWTFQFPYDGDTCYLAHSYPYTYSDLQRYLRKMTSDPAVSVYCKPRVLCSSLAGNAVYVLTITSPSSSREEGQAKKAVVVTARVHPGETNSSWIMQGFLDFLLSDVPDAKLLRDTFIFKVVPMLNPDGVVVGNYRCSLTGCDLNRNYCTLLRDSFPCVWHTHSMVKRLMAEREVILYCDLHGHSRKNNVFIYGCDKSSTVTHLYSRVFPLMMSKNVADKFSYKSCKFKVHKSKEGTGRVVMWKLGITNSYTMETTFGGSTLGNRKGTHFSTQDLKSLGYNICDTLLDYCDPDPAKANQCLAELRAILRQEIQQKLGIDVESDGLSSISVSDSESSTSGSNSSESDGLPVHLLYDTNKEHTRSKKHLKTHKERNRLRQKQSHMKNASGLITESKITVPMQQQPMRVEDTNRKTDKALFVTKEFSHRRQTWVPPSTSSVSVFGQVSLVNSCMEPVATVNPKYGRVLDCTKKPEMNKKVFPNKRQSNNRELLLQKLQFRRQPDWYRWLPKSAQQYGAHPATIQPRSFALSWNLETNICNRGNFSAFHCSMFRSSAGSCVFQSRAVPEKISNPPSAACGPSTTLVLKDNPKLPTRIQPKQVTITYFIPNITATTTDSTEMIKRQETKHLEKRKACDGLPLLEKPGKSAGNVQSFLPELKKQDLLMDFQKQRNAKKSGDLTEVRPGKLHALEKEFWSRSANEQIPGGDAAIRNINKWHRSHESNQ